MAATDRLDVTRHYPGLLSVGGSETPDGDPILYSVGFLQSRAFALSLNPHTIHNLSAATRAQTCDLAYARDAADLYFDEVFDALAAKDYEGAFRANRRLAAFEARTRELEGRAVGIDPKLIPLPDGQLVGNYVDGAEE